MRRSRRAAAADASDPITDDRSEVDVNEDTHVPRRETRRGRPKRELTVNFPVRLDNGEVQVFTGFRIHHNTVLGPSKGGIRYSLHVNQDEIRALELNELARRSIERRRAYTLDFQEATEEVGFKGTMTLVGCALLWLIPVVLLLSAWLPWLGWLIVPVLLAFLALQLLKARAPTRPE